MNRAALGFLVAAALFLSGTARPAGAGLEDSFGPQIADLAYAGKARYDATLRQREPFPCKPGSLAANRLIARVNEVRALTALEVFGEEGLKALEKVLGRGGLKGASEMVGMMRDAASSSSAEEFVEKQVVRKLKSRAGNAGVDPRVTAALKKLYEELKKRAGSGPKTLYEATRQVGECPNGAEVFRVKLNPGDMTLILELDAADCCAEGAGASAVDEYHALVVGNLVPVADGDDVSWNVTLSQAAFWGYCCGADRAPYERFWSGMYPLRRVPRTGVQPQIPDLESYDCSEIDCDNLIRTITELDALIEFRRARIADLKGGAATIQDIADEEDHDEADQLQNEVDALIRGLEGMLRAFEECCNKPGELPDTFRGIFQKWMDRLPDHGMVPSTGTGSVPVSYPAGTPQPLICLDVPRSAPPGEEPAGTPWGGIDVPAGTVISIVDLPGACMDPRMPVPEESEGDRYTLAPPTPETEKTAEAVDEVKSIDFTAKPRKKMSPEQAQQTAAQAVVWEMSTPDELGKDQLVERVFQNYDEQMEASGVPAARREQLDRDVRQDIEMSVDEALKVRDRIR